MKLNIWIWIIRLKRGDKNSFYIKINFKGSAKAFLIFFFIFYFCILGSLSKYMFNASPSPPTDLLISMQKNLVCNVFCSKTLHYKCHIKYACLKTFPPLSYFLVHKSCLLWKLKFQFLPLYLCSGQQSWEPSAAAGGFWWTRENSEASFCILGECHWVIPVWDLSTFRYWE